MGTSYIKIFLFTAQKPHWYIMTKWRIYPPHKRKGLFGALGSREPPLNISWMCIEQWLERGMTASVHMISDPKAERVGPQPELGANLQMPAPSGLLLPVKPHLLEVLQIPTFKT